MDLHKCNICPRNCNADRLGGKTGYCGNDGGFNIASICIHNGEEPVISGEKGICNIFFTGCNMRCIYCQNHSISRHECISGCNSLGLHEIVNRVEEILETGVRAVGFVSPSHMIPQMLRIIEGIHSRGLKPVTVFNTGAYDKPDTIRLLDGIIDVYLPDFKYITGSFALRMSDAPCYPETALRVIREMYRQKGSVLFTDASGQAESGLLIRHLVLPGHADESKKVLRTIAEELSPGVHISLMSQYHPVDSVMKDPDLGRTLYREEYEDVIRELELLGFRNGFVQDIDSNCIYRPDFSKDHPFE